MSTTYNGITANTPNELLLDAGALYLGYTDGNSPGTLLGATRGGSEWTAGITLREMEVDGARGPVKGMKRIERVEPVLTVNILSLTAANIKRMLPYTDIDDLTQPGYDIMTGREVTDSDYQTNIALVTRTSIGSKPVVLIVENTLPNGDWTINTEHMNEASPSIAFAGHFDPDDIDTFPFEIRWPNGESDS